MSPVEHSGVPGVFPDSVDDGVTLDSRAQKSRQFKHFIVTPNDARFDPNKKRKKWDRIRVACSECSFRKIKCSGDRPICKGCQKLKVQCVYREKGSNSRQQNDQNEDIEQSAAPIFEDEELVGERIEEATAASHIRPPSSHSVQRSDFNASLNGNFDILSNWPTSCSVPNPSGSPGRPDMSSADMFLAQTPIPILHPHVDPRDSSKIRVPYIRWFGPTGIVPGFTKVLVDLRRASAASEKSASTNSSPSNHATSPPDGLNQDSIPGRTRQSHQEEQPESILFDVRDDMVPSTDVLEHLLPIFFDYFGSQFSFYQKGRFMESVRSDSVPAVLLNSMCALASRYSYHPNIRRDPIYMCGEIFGEKAKQLLVVLLAVPSYDLVASLLMISWYEFGCNRDVGFWMYSGMAIRMAQDLGMHKLNEDAIRSGKATPTEGDQSGGVNRPRENGDWREDEDASMQLNLFWSIYFIDRIISLGTGRPLTLRDDQISCPLPSDGSSDLERSISPSPFPHMIRIMIVQGRANEEVSTILQPQDLTVEKKATLCVLQDDIIQIYNNLDPRLAFNASNFRNYVGLGFGSVYLLLHVWFHAVIITLHRPGLMSGKGTLAHTLGKESLEVSMSSANTITAILGSAELIDERTITGNPFINQAIYIAGLAFIAESEMYGQHLTSSDDQISQPSQNGRSQSFAEDQPNISSFSGTTSTDTAYQFSQTASIPTTTFPDHLAQSFTSPTSSTTTMPSIPVPSTASSTLLQSASKRNYQVCLQALTSLKTYWRGIGWILGTMEQKAKGVVLTDPSEESVDPESKIDLRDAGMLQRLAAVKRTRRHRTKGTCVGAGDPYAASAASTIHPVVASGRTSDSGRVLEVSGRNQSWASYGWVPNGFGVSVVDGWVDLAWVDAMPASNTGFTPPPRQGGGENGAHSGVWALD